MVRRQASLSRAFLSLLYKRGLGLDVKLVSYAFPSLLYEGALVRRQASLSRAFPSLLYKKGTGLDVRLVSLISVSLLSIQEGAWVRRRAIISHERFPPFFTRRA